MAGAFLYFNFKNRRVLTPVEFYSIILVSNFVHSLFMINTSKKDRGKVLNHEHDEEVFGNE